MGSEKFDIANKKFLKTVPWVFCFLIFKKTNFVLFIVSRYLT